MNDIADAEVTDSHDLRFSATNHITRSESIYGKGFQSPGGKAAFRSIILSRLELDNIHNILEVGSGLGGAAFCLATENNVAVTGLDLAQAMIRFSKSRMAEYNTQKPVEFICGDMSCNALKGRSFDCIMSIDTVLYIENKHEFFKNIAQHMNPGAQLVISDFCKDKTSAKFEAYQRHNMYYLKNLGEYRQILLDCGFDAIDVNNVSHETLHFMRLDFQNFKVRLENNEIDISKADARYIVERWTNKIHFLESQQMVQGLLIARRT